MLTNVFGMYVSCWLMTFSDLAIKVRLYKMDWRAILVA